MATTLKRRRHGDLKPTLANTRSAVTNGSMLFDGIDHRSAWMRRLRDLIAAHTSDLGGQDLISEAEHVLVRRASMLCLQLELMEHRWATEHEGQAGPKSLDSYQRCTNTLRRVHESLGLKRRPRDITPDPLTYAKQYDRHAEDVEEVA